MEDIGIWLRFVLGVCATWRISHLLVHEDGPARVLARLRRRVGTMLDCFGCVSLWIAIPLALYAAPGTLDRVVAWLALSGAAFLLESALPQPLHMQPFEEQTIDGVLRTDTE